MIELRPYQLEAVEKIRERVREGYKSVLLVMMTGAGKTCVAANIMTGALNCGSKLLFVAHRREIIAQTYAKMLAMDVPEEKLGVIMGDGKIRINGRVIKAARRDAPIQIGSIDTLRNRKIPEADIVFRDEAHRCLSKSDLALKAKYPNAIHIGLTATPYRIGMKGLGTYYSVIVVGALPSFLIKEGYIVEPRVWTVPPEELPDLTGVKTRNGDFREEDLVEACNTKKLVGSIVEHWKKHAGNRRTVCFPVSIAHSKSIVSDFIAAGIPAEHIDGTMSSEIRDGALARLERGEILVISNVGILQEGWDMPSVKCVILARPTKSTGLMIQQAGRILRPWNDTEAIILDHAGCVIEHGLPHEDREYSLEDSKPKRKGMSTKTCLGCFAVVESIHSVCPACGKPFPVQSRDAGDRSVTHVDGQLVQYGDTEKEKEKKSYWEQLCDIASKNNYKDGWAAWKFKEKFGFWPPKSYKRPIGRAMTQGERDVMRAKLMRVARERNLPIAWVESKMEKQTQLVEIINEREAVIVPPVASSELRKIEQIPLLVSANDGSQTGGTPVVPSAPVVPVVTGETVRWDL